MEKSLIKDVLAMDVSRVGQGSDGEKLDQRCSSYGPQSSVTRQ